jgi:hypothetical protein
MRVGSEPMKFWVLIGLVMVGIAVPMLVGRANLSPAREASIGLLQLGSDLEAYARAHEGRYPLELADLGPAGFPTFASGALDPWGRAYEYERHPKDPTRCRAWSTGPDAHPGSRPGDDDVVLYKIRSRTLWKQALGDVPPDWTSLP